MHDPTEGGIAGGVHEIADASDVGVRIFEKKIPVALETFEVCRFFQIDPLQLIGSGALLISAEPSAAEKIVDELSGHDIEATVIGRFLQNPETRIIVHADGSEAELGRPVCDHLWLALEQ